MIASKLNGYESKYEGVLDILLYLSYLKVKGHTIFTRIEFLDIIYFRESAVFYETEYIFLDILS